MAYMSLPTEYPPKGVSNRWWKKRVWEVVKRDGRKCNLCGYDQDESNLNVDHIMPLALGGSDAVTNLQILCKVCHIKKDKNVPLLMGIARDIPLPEVTWEHL
jgi:5-methylcytosine-specific restriction endonuclease McrA